MKRNPIILGKCKCGGDMVCKQPTHPKANVRCNKCGSVTYLTTWRALMTPNRPNKEQ